MTARVARRLGGQARRTKPVRRASAGLSATRAGAALAALLAAGAIYGVGASAAFGFQHLAIEGTRFTSEADLRRMLGVADGTNLFLLSTEAVEARIGSLTTVAAVDVEVRLPDTIRIAVTDRQAVMTWRVGERAFLADAAGVLFAEVGAADAGASAVPSIDDRRAASAALGVGSVLAPVDLDAATRLGSLEPAQLGSTAVSFGVAITDEHGFVLRAEPDGWTAIFGFYTPSLRTPDLVPGQVYLLSSLLQGRETQIQQVILASDTDGTYVPRATAAP